MNPPNCKSRAPTQTELSQIATGCESDNECIDYVMSRPNIWKYCKDIGMAIRIVDGKRVAYFPPPATPIISTAYPSPSSNSFIDALLPVPSPTQNSKTGESLNKINPSTIAVAILVATLVGSNFLWLLSKRKK